MQGVFYRNKNGELAEWRRTPMRQLRPDLLPGVQAGADEAVQGRDEKFLEDLIAAQPQLLGLGLYDDESDIDGPFQCFAQRAVTAFNGRTIYPDLLILSQSGHVVIVEVKLGDNPELRDRRVVAQVLEYAACLADYSEEDLFALLEGPEQGATTWSGLIHHIFPTAPDSDRLARRILSRFQNADLHLVIACDEVPAGLRELVRGVLSQAALGEFRFRVVEVAAFTSPDGEPDLVLVPDVKMQTEVVQRTAVTVRYESGQARPGVEVAVTSLAEARAQTETAIERATGVAWTETTFFADAASRMTAEDLAAVRAFYEAVMERGYRLRWGKGAKTGTVLITIPALSEKYAVSLNSDGTLWFNFGNLDPDVAEDLKAKLRALPGMTFSDRSSASVRLEIWRPLADRILDLYADAAAAGERSA